MAEDIRLAKGEEVDALREQLCEKVDTATLENDGYLKKKIVGALPYMEEEINFTDGISKFTAVNRTAAVVFDDAEKGKCQKITTASNAGNTYAFAYLDFSSFSVGAKKLTVEFDLKIAEGSRWFIALSDLSQRPATSYRAAYDKKGVVIHQGTKDGTNYYINSTNTQKTAYFDKWMHSEITIDFEEKTVTYRMSNGTITDILSGTIDFCDTSVEQATGIDIYSYVSNAEAFIGDIFLSGHFGDETDERTLYFIREGDGSYGCYIYIDNKPVRIGKSDLLEMYSDLLARVEALESKGG